MPARPSRRLCAGPRVLLAEFGLTSGHRVDQVRNGDRSLAEERSDRAAGGSRGAPGDRPLSELAVEGGGPWRLRMRSWGAILSEGEDVWLDKLFVKWEEVYIRLGLWDFLARAK